MKNDGTQVNQPNKATHQLEDGQGIPEHYTIGDDGQIVELNPARKRSKKPHPH
ncbi:MAG: hypothetical protein U0694_09190 [Anaerolineae bacterium]